MERLRLIGAICIFTGIPLLIKGVVVLNWYSEFWGWIVTSAGIAMLSLGCLIEFFYMERWGLDE